jgi:predicted ABC-type ATPase
MVSAALESVFVDVDDTLVRSAGSKRIPIAAVVDRVRALKQAGATLYCWSRGGAEYARASALEVGLEDCFVSFLPKPTNGAGKTTFAREFLPDEADCPAFVNADLIAAGLSPFNPEVVAMRAGRIMLELIDEHVSRGDSFIRNDARRQELRSSHPALAGRVTLLFLALPSAEAALQRVRERVAQGGHSIPEAVVRRRFFAGKLNFEAVYTPLVDAWALCDNSNGEPILLSWGEK